MEPVFILLLLAVVAPIAFLIGHAKRQTRIQQWMAAAGAAGLTDVQGPGTFFGALTGRAGRLGVRIERYQHGENEHGTRITIDGLGHGLYGLELRREGFKTAIEKAMGGKEIEVGDAAFDQEAFIQGNVALARALLDAETRRLLRGLLTQQFELRDRSLVQVRGRLSESTLRIEVPEVSFISREIFGRFPSGSSRFSEVLDAAIALAGRLAAPTDIPGRIARNLLGDPEDSVRLQCLLTLIREYPGHATTREALLAAREDRSAEVRLRAGIALGEEGRAMLLDLASWKRAEDSFRARAIAALGENLPMESAERILEGALADRCDLTARACLEALGRRGGREVVPTMTKVVIKARGSLGAAAARALGASGAPEAESPLLEALEAGDAEVRVAAAEALGRIGTVAAVPLLRDCASRFRGDGSLKRAVRQAVASIQSRLAGAEPGQLSLAGADGEAGMLSLVEDDRTGRLTLAEKEEEEQRDTPPPGREQTGEKA